MAMTPISVCTDSLVCRCKQQYLNNCLCRMAAEHFYKLHPHNKRQCICKKLCKKINVHIQNGNFSDRIDQPDTPAHDQITMESTISVYLATL